MPICAIVGCFNGYQVTKTRPNPERHQSFLMPKDPALKKKWIEKINRKDAYNAEKAYVCIKHFKDEDFKSCVGQKDLAGRIRTLSKLKDGAVPSLYLRGQVPVLKSGNTRSNGKEANPPEPKVYASKEHLEHDHTYCKIIDPIQNDPQANQEQIILTAEETPSVENDEVVEAMDYQDMEAIIINDAQVNTLEIEVQENESSTADNYKKLLAEKDSENEKLKQELAKQKATLDALSKVFQPDQLYRVTYPLTRDPWSDLTLQKSMQTYFTCGRRGYQFLYEKVLPNLIPEKSTIVRQCNKIESTFGTQYDMIKLMGMKTKTFKKRDLKAVVILDESAMLPKREYDASTGEIIGHPTLPVGPELLKKRLRKGIDNSKVLATHFLNVLCVGLVKPWKQLVGYHLTDASFCPKACAEWLREILDLLFAIHIEILLVIHDMGLVGL